MPKGYLTGDTLTDDYICRSVRIPNEGWFIQALDGAIYDFCQSFNWHTFGTIPAQDAADRAFAMFQDYLDSMCVPIGTVTAFAGSTPPIHNLLCDGASYLETAYPKLFAVIGYTFGGSSPNFNVPDLRGRLVAGVGIGTGLTPRTLADSYGEETHVLTISELASHTHIDTGHTHLDNNATTFAGFTGVPPPIPSAIPSVTITGSGSANLTATGSDAPHNNLNPALALTYIIASD